MDEEPRICPECGRERKRTGGWFLGPLYDHEPHDRTCLRNQLEDARAEIHRLKAETDILRDLAAGNTVQAAAPVELLTTEQLAEELTSRVPIAAIFCAPMEMSHQIHGHPVARIDPFTCLKAEGAPEVYILIRGLRMLIQQLESAGG